MKNSLNRLRLPLLGAIALSLAAVAPVPTVADETCSSPYLARIDGQEEFVYVWTLGVPGLGDGADKLVTVFERILHGFIEADF